jgi:histidinol-phosphate/aromatic aminotransferase/cobyric acid decarboxylase-like protein/SAM-dependent methyltransferase
MSEPRHRSLEEDPHRHPTDAEDAARTRREVEYLCRVIGRPGAGVRVLDLGCGAGRRAVALARKGFLVTGVDGSSAALARARAVAAMAGVSVDFLELDFLALDMALPVHEIDAAICLRSPALGKDDDHLRLLQTVRGCLTDRGVLVLDHVNPMWLARNVPPRVDPGADRAILPDGAYDLVAGRYRGGITVSQDGAQSRRARHGVRLYTVPELTNLVRAAGFDIAQVHADFDAEGTPTLDTRHVQIVATPAPVAPASLSLRVHRAEAAAPILNLKWSPDEVEWLEPAPEEIWSSMLASGPGEIARLSRDYALTDPWGGERAAAAISSFFGVGLSPESIVFGAGATGLLRQISPVVRAGCLLTTPLVHQDFPLWAAAEAARFEWMADACDDDRMREAIAASAPTMVYLDRPSATGAVIPLGSIVRICREALRHGSLVAIDEAYHAYFAGANSAVSLVPALDNLIVIRSLSKAYCCGGLRVGFAVGGTIAARALRRLVAPLQVSELAFQMGLRLLEAGDIFEKLRRRIGEAKSAMAGLLVRNGLEVAAGHENLPWVLVDDASGHVEAELRGRGIAGKRLVPFSPAAAPGIGWLRLAVPLSEERMAHFHRLMGPR